MPQTFAGTPTLGNQTQLPLVVGPVVEVVCGAARLTFAHESANADTGTAAATAAATNATRSFLLTNSPPNEFIRCAVRDRVSHRSGGISDRVHMTVKTRWRLGRYGVAVRYIPFAPGL